MKTFFKLFICLTILIIGRNASQAQTTAQEFTNKNTIYLELGGSGGAYSLNYGRLIHQKNMYKLNGSFGFSVSPYFKGHLQPDYKVEVTNRLFDPTLTAELTGMIGKSRHHLEGGFGYTYHYEAELQLIGRDDDYFYFKYKGTGKHALFSRFGYRYQKPQGGFLFRAGFTPTLISSKNKLYGDNKETFFLLRGGLSFGWSF